MFWTLLTSSASRIPHHWRSSCRVFHGRENILRRYCGECQGGTAVSLYRTRSYLGTVAFKSFVRRVEMLLPFRPIRTKRSDATLAYVLKTQMRGRFEVKTVFTHQVMEDYGENVDLSWNWRKWCRSPKHPDVREKKFERAINERQSQYEYILKFLETGPETSPLSKIPQENTKSQYKDKYMSTHSKTWKLPAPKS